MMQSPTDTSTSISSIATTNNKSDDDNFSMPAEWSPHEATLMVYPHCSFTFRLNKVRMEFQNLIKTIATVGEEPVVLFCPTEQEALRMEKELLLLCCTNIYTRVCPTNDSWARDMGPTFIVSKDDTRRRRRIGLDWDFNAWGGPEEGCYWPCEQDQAACATMCQELDDLWKTNSTTTKKVPLILEGGSIHVDGEGTVLTTQECLLHPNRNPTKTQQEIETIVLESLGASKMIWLPHGVDGDQDTNGHVDNFACFSKPGHIILSWTDDKEHDKVNYQRCREALELLEQETDAHGRSLTVHKLHLPPPMFYTQEQVESLDLYNGELPRNVGERMAGSYVNFYITNKAIIVPQFGHTESDERAIDTLAQIFPERRVVGVHSKEILIGGGNIHCVTQQVPKV